MQLKFAPLIPQLTALARQRRHPTDLVRGRLQGEGINLYVRLGPRFCGGQVFQALVLADIEVAAAVRRQGLFRLALRRLEAEAPLLGLQAVVVENVINPHLLKFLLRQGYRPVRLTHDTLFKETPHATHH